MQNSQVVSLRLHCAAREIAGEGKTGLPVCLPKTRVCVAMRRYC